MVAGKPLITTPIVVDTEIGKIPHFRASPLSHSLRAKPVRKPPG